jgi:hypothetical protein
MKLNERMKQFDLPQRIRQLPISPAGFPAPWFVAWFRDGKPCDPGQGTPDFRVIDTPKIGIAIRQKRCWVCGGFLGRHLAFVIGPMCAINRVISEPEVLASIDSGFPALLELAERQGAEAVSALAQYTREAMALLPKDAVHGS